MTGRVLDAAEAERYGIVTRVWPKKPGARSGVPQELAAGLAKNYAAWCSVNRSSSRDGGLRRIRAPTEYSIAARKTGEEARPPEKTPEVLGDEVEIFHPPSRKGRTHDDRMLVLAAQEYTDTRTLWTGTRLLGDRPVVLIATACAIEAMSASWGHGLRHFQKLGVEGMRAPTGRGQHREARGHHAAASSGFWRQRVPGGPSMAPGPGVAGRRTQQGAVAGPAAAWAC
jgi:hypothetical protein